MVRNAFSYRLYSLGQGMLLQPSVEGLNRLGTPVVHGLFKMDHIESG